MNCSTTSRVSLRTGSQVASRSFLIDLSQCVRGRVALGIGLYAELEATELMHPAVGFVDMTLVPRASLGWDPRRSPTFGQVRTAAMPTAAAGSAANFDLLSRSCHAGRTLDSGTISISST